MERKQISTAQPYREVRMGKQEDRVHIRLRMAILAKRLNKLEKIKARLLVQLRDQRNLLDALESNPNSPGG